jgi:23S rRNA (cytosine1962-C5)-methyltransferase
MKVTLRLRKPLERSLRSGHPWLYREALEAFEAPPGTPVRVVDRKGKFVASGLAEEGPIGVRVFSLDDRPVGERLFAARFEAAFALRAGLALPDTDAYRLVHGEGDRIPGVVCDRYGSAAVLKIDGSAALAHAATFARLLEAPLRALGVASLLLRTGRKQDETVDVTWGAPPEREVSVREYGMRLVANLYDGQKTGLFLDHRETRARVRRASAGLSVLNLYGYTGGFSVAAGLGGAARVVTVDLAKPALALASRSWSENGLPAEQHAVQAGDAIEYIAAAADSGARYGLVIADPPNFAPRKSALDAALAAYQALHGAVLRTLAPGGIYVAASCSSHVDMRAFEDTVLQGAARARKVLQVLERSGAPADHPRLLSFPEGDYLKVLVLRVV